MPCRQRNFIFPLKWADATQNSPLSLFDLSSLAAYLLFQSQSKALQINGVFCCRSLLFIISVSAPSNIILPTTWFTHKGSTAAAAAAPTHDYRQPLPVCLFFLKRRNRGWIKTVGADTSATLHVIHPICLDRHGGIGTHSKMHSPWLTDQGVLWRLFFYTNQWKGVRAGALVCIDPLIRARVPDLHKTRLCFDAKRR